MVKKLIKHEFIYYLRSFGIFPLMILAVSLVVRLFMFFDTDSTVVTVLGTSSLIVFFISCFTIGIASVIFSVVRFYQNMYSAEGYLTFTLPVTNDAHIFVKLLVALTCQLISHLTVTVAMLIALSDKEMFAALAQSFSGLGKLISTLGAAHSVFYFLEGLILIVLSAIMTMLLYYACITIGQMAKKNRVFGAIATYFVYYMGMQVLSTAITIILSTVAITGIFDGLLFWIGRHPLASIHIGLWLAIIIVGGLGTAFWFIIRTIMNKKLNLE